MSLVPLGVITRSTRSAIADVLAQDFVQMLRAKGLGEAAVVRHAVRNALPQILAQLKQNGFKVVHMVPKDMLTTLPQYDEAVLKENKLPTLASNKAAESVVRTVGGE